MLASASLTAMSILTCSKVEAKVRLSANNLTPLEKLIGSKFIALSTDPSKLRPTLINTLLNIKY